MRSQPRAGRGRGEGGFTCSDEAAGRSGYAGQSFFREKD